MGFSPVLGPQSSKDVVSKWSSDSPNGRLSPKNGGLNGSQIAESMADEVQGLGEELEDPGPAIVLRPTMTHGYYRPISAMENRQRFYQGDMYRDIQSTMSRISRILGLLRTKTCGCRRWFHSELHQYSLDERVEEKEDSGSRWIRRFRIGRVRPLGGSSLPRRSGCSLCRWIE